MVESVVVIRLQAIAFQLSRNRPSALVPNCQATKKAYIRMM
jgi:hypothetical protein